MGSLEMAKDTARVLSTVIRFGDSKNVQDLMQHVRRVGQRLIAAVPSGL